MELIGFVFLLVLGIALTLGSTQAAIGWYALSGRFTIEQYVFVLLFAIGAIILWYAFCNAPFTIVFSNALS